MIPIKTIPLVTGRAEEWANGCEQYAVHLTYDLKPLLEKWPDAMPSVAFERADGEKYPHEWEQEEDVLHIPLTKADTAIAGLCKCVVTVISGDGQHNSDVFHGRVSQGLDTLGEEPDEPMQGIIEQVNGAAVRAESAANNAADDAQAAHADAETANAAALAAGAQAQNAASAAVRSESGAARAEEAAERAENAEVPSELIADMIENYLEENPPEAPVQSVNGQTGEVELTAADVGALPEDTEIPKPYTLPAATADGLGGVRVGNGLSVLADGTLSASAESVGALPDTYQPPEAPVQSVNGQTGAIVLTASDVGAATWETVYPVGAVYISTNSTSPASLFGGSWEQIKERFLFGAGDTYTAGGTGGEFGANHKHLTTIGYDGQTFYGAEVPGIGGTVFTGSYAGAYVNKTSVIALTTQYLAYTNEVWLTNMPPYLNVYMWKRTA